MLYEVKNPHEFPIEERIARILKELVSIEPNKNNTNNKHIDACLRTIETIVNDINVLYRCQDDKSIS